MLNHPTLDRLTEPGLDGMAKGFRDLVANPESRSLEHAEWLGLLVEQEATLRQQRRFEARSRTAKLRQAARIEDVDYRTPRNLDRAMFLRLAACDWVRAHHHCLITGPCGTGKSWLVCALGERACRENLSALYQRSSRLFGNLALARGRWPIWQAAAPTRPRGPADPRRLGPRAADRRAAPRPAGNCRGSLQCRFADHHQPGAGGTLVRDRRRPDPGRRHPRPPRPQRPSHRAHRRNPAQTAGFRLTLDTRL